MAYVLSAYLLVAFRPSALCTSTVFVAFYLSIGVGLVILPSKRYSKTMSLRY